MVTKEQVQAWAAGAGLPACVVQLYANEHSGQLPAVMSQFCQWARDTGRRTEDGQYHCGETSAVGVTTNETQGLGNWALRNAGLVAAVAGAVLLARRRRR